MPERYSPQHRIRLRGSFVLPKQLLDCTDQRPVMVGFFNDVSRLRRIVGGGRSIRPAYLAQHHQRSPVAARFVFVRTLKFRRIGFVDLQIKHDDARMLFSEQLEALCPLFCFENIHPPSFEDRSQNVTSFLGSIYDENAGGTMFRCR